MWMPSGDHDGHVSCASGVVVIRVWFEPSASITQRSQFENSSRPQREYAIRVPSAFQSGIVSRARGVRVSRTVPPVSGSTTKTSV
jgi:hypothetical protein